MESCGSVPKFLLHCCTARKEELAALAGIAAEMPDCVDFFQKKDFEAGNPTNLIGLCLPVAFWIYFVGSSRRVRG